MWFYRVDIANLFLWFEQKFLILTISICAILKSKNPFITKFFNNGICFILLFILFLMLDLLINLFFKDANWISNYNLFYLLSQNYLPVLVVVLVHRIYKKYSKQIAS